MTKRTNRKTKQKPVKTLPLKTAKISPIKSDKNQHAKGYYQCLCNESKNGLKGNITSLTRHCKVNSSAVIKARNQEISKIMNSYQQIGASLTKLLQH